MKDEFKPFDASEYLETPDDMAGYLDACMDEDTGDGVLIIKALKNIAHAYGMIQLAKDTGLSCESLYEALGEDGNPELGTMLRIINALGIKLHATTT